MVEVKGDLFEHVPSKCVIPHVVNNQSVFGAGFVVPLKKHFPKAENDYFDYLRGLNAFQREDVLGAVCFSQNNGIIVAHMFAQTLGGKRPLRYDKLVHCMEKVHDYAKLRGLSIICPRFGSGLAGADWNFIKELINDIWSDLDGTIYYL